MLTEKFYLNAFTMSNFCLINNFLLSNRHLHCNWMPNFRKFCAKLSFAYWKILVKCLHHEQFLLNWQFSALQPPLPAPIPSVKWVKILEWLLSFYTFSGTPLKIYHICTRERTFSSHCWYRMSHLSYQSFLIEKPCIIK